MTTTHTGDPIPIDEEPIDPLWALETAHARLRSLEAIAHSAVVASEAAPAAVRGRPDRRARRLTALVAAVHREAGTALAEVEWAICRVNEEVGAVRAAVRSSIATGEKHDDDDDAQRS